MALHTHIHGGQLTLVAETGLAVRNSWAAVQLSTGQRWTTQGAVARSEADGWLLCRAGDGLQPEVRWHIVPEAGQPAIRLWLEVENTTPQTLAVERLDVLVAPDGLGGSSAAELEVLQTGWQSWSLATPPLPLGQLNVDSGPPVLAPLLPPTEATRTLIPWMTVVRTPDNRSLLAGFITARDQLGIIAVQPTISGHRLTASSYAEGLPVPPGATLRSESLLLIVAQPDPVALEQYARLLASEMQAQRWPSIPTGWCSWYHFFTAVTEADVLRNLEALAERREHWPIDVVQLDDGYQAEIGDWLTLNDKFPNGMPFLTQAIRSHGYQPGLWLAPFLVSEHSVVFREHPDWVLRNEQGEPLLAIHNWNARQFALDTTHPGVANWLRQVVATMVDDWGYDYLKIDFVYAAALRARRYDPAITSVQAYRRGLEIIRQAAGDRFILGCGAPFAPSVGLVEGMRIGPDVAPFWRNERPPGSEPSLHDAIRSTLVHTWMHPHLWLNDPDCVLLRQADSSLTLAQIQSWISLVGMSGGMVLFSDDLGRLEPEREALAARLLPPLGRPGRPLEPYVDAMPSRMQLWIETASERWLLAAQFNWADEPQTLVFQPADWEGLAGSGYHLFDHWTGQHWGLVTGPVDLGVVPAHGIRLLAVHLNQNRPQMIGSTLHILNGAVEVAAETWDGETLTVSLACPGRRSGHLAVVAPESYRYWPEPGQEDAVTWHGDHWLVPVEMSDRHEVSLRFAQDGP